MPKPEKIPEDWVRCPKCFSRYSSYSPRVSLWKPSGERYELCLTDAAQEYREAQQSTPPKQERPE